MTKKSLTYTTGSPAPIGATLKKNGVNFSVFAQNAKSIELLLFSDKDDITPSHTFKITKDENKSYYYWHIFIEDITAGQYYAYRVDGEYNPSKSFAYDKSKLLIDPYAKGIYAKNYDRRKATEYGIDNIAYAYKSVVIDDDNYDWEGDTHLSKKLSDLVIYEMHIGGFTNAENSGIEKDKRGTFAAVIEKIPYLKSLGINAIELMPVFAFDEQDAPYNKSNYWGYSPISFFSIHNAFGTQKEPISAINEFKDMIKALHKEGIEVILDVVYNHTSEADYNGPLQSMRGFDNGTYYIINENDKSEYLDFTGCSNTFNANRISQADYGLEDSCYELNRESARIAREAADKFTKKNPDKPRFVVGTMGPTNKTASMSPDVNDPGFRAVSFEELVEAYAEETRGLIDGGADILMIETIFDTLNAKGALFAISQVFKEKNIELPIMVSGTITDASGRTLSGQTVEAFLNSVSHLKLLSIGLNCALGAADMKPYIDELSKKAPFHISAHPNAGLPNQFGEYDESAEEMGAIIEDYLKNGFLFFKHISQPDLT